MPATRLIASEGAELFFIKEIDLGADRGRARLTKASPRAAGTRYNPGLGHDIDSAAAGSPEARLFEAVELDDEKQVSVANPVAVDRGGVLCGHRSSAV